MCTDSHLLFTPVDCPGVILGFDQATYQVIENQTNVEVCVNISDIPEEGLECDVQVTVSFLNSTKAGRIQFYVHDLCVSSTRHPTFSTHPVHRVDFNITGSTEIVFPSGVTVSGDQQCLKVTIEDDMILEGQHSITLHMSAVYPAGQITFDTIYSEILIEDNDGKGITNLANTILI